MRVAVFCVVSVFIDFICMTQGTLCPGDSQLFGENRCASVSTESMSSSYEAASTYCEDTFNQGELATFTTNGELFTIESYVSVLGSDGNQYWVGYQYNGTTLQDINGNTASSLVTNDLNANSLLADTGTCVSIDSSGSLNRASCTSLWGQVCVFTLTDPSVSSITVNNSVVVSGTRTLSIGVDVDIECLFSDVSSDSAVEWSVDGNSITENIVTTNDRTSSVLTLSPFLQSGEYRCTVTNSDGQTGSSSVQLFGDINNVIAPPTPVNAFASIADSQTSLYIQWNEPDRSYVVNPLLVSYTLYYSTQRPLNYSNSPSISNLRVGTNKEGTNKEGIYLLTGLQPGTVYYMGMRAENEAGISDDPSFTQIATTYGNAPSTAPTNLMLSRNGENSALLAAWDSADAPLPIGPVAFYRVEFRDTANTDIITTLFANPRFSAASIFNLRDAQAYEVRVSTAVQTHRLPAQYEYSPFTDWVEAKGIVDEIPIFPTSQPVEETNATTIILSVVLPILIVSVIIVVIVIVIAIWWTRRKATEQTDGPCRCKNPRPMVTNEAVGIPTTDSNFELR